MKVYGLPIHENYWMTETGCNVIANFYGLPLKVGSMGKPFPGIEAAIVDDKGKVLPPGVPGNIAIKPGLAVHDAGYLEQPGRSMRSTSGYRDGTSQGIADSSTRTATSGSPAGWTT